MWVSRIGLAARRRVLLRYERELWARGLTHVAGVDEVGVGPLAGPLVAAAVILPREMRPARRRRLEEAATRAARTRLSAEIEACALAVGIGVVEVEEVDRLNTFWAALEAMRRAVRALPVRAEHLLVDARRIPDLDMPQTSLIKGDARSYSIAAASIVAKVARDAMMDALDGRLSRSTASPATWATARAEHLAALARHGPCPVHRRSFLPVCQARLPGLLIAARADG